MDVGLKEIFTMTLMRTSREWAGHVERMGDDKLTKRAETGGIKEARLLRENCVKRDPERKPDAWRITDTGRGNGRLLIPNTV